MHRSRLGGFIIDCATDDLETAAEFWAQALGMRKRRSESPADSKYIGLAGDSFDLYAEVQKVTHPSRVHLDIETDDVEAEIARLKMLGAREVERIRSWCVMEAPTGQRFCIVPRCTAEFDERANRWD